MENNSSSAAVTVAPSAEHRPGYAPMKKEYIDRKNDSPTPSFENCEEMDIEKVEKPKRKYRGINRERGKKMAKKGMSWPVRAVCEVRSEAIIWAVEQLPCLWDLTSEDYRDRSKRRQGWSTVSRMLINDYEKKDDAERQTIEKEIQNKWKNIRDCYVRDVRRKNGEPVKSRGKRTREYMHAGLLAFLDSSYMPQPRVVRSPKTDPENGYDFILDTVVKPFLEQSAEISCDWIKQETLEAKIGKILEERSLEDDEDSAFFSSLLPTIRNLDPEQKVEFRLEVLQALRQIATKQSSPPLILQPESPDASGDSGFFSGTSGPKSSPGRSQAAEDFIISLRDMQQECSSSSTSSSSSLPQLTSDTQ